MEGCRENVVECECGAGGGGAGGGSLDVLAEVQKAYEHRMELLEKLPTSKRMPMQVCVLKQWVSDLAAQNSLLARAVEELEGDASARLYLDQRKNTERDKRSVSCGAYNEMKILNETLRKENCSKEREIRKLHKDAQQYEQTIMGLRSEISLSKYQTPECSKKDVEVMAGMCCTGAECGDWAPVKDFNSVLREEMLSYQERIQKMESNLKASGEDVRALRKVNVGLRDELHALRGVCAALGEQARAAALRGQFKDEIIREMRRQLKHAKAKTKEAAELISVKSRGSTELDAPYERVTIACVRPRAALHRAASRSLSDDGRSPRLVVSGEDLLSE